VWFIDHTLVDIILVDALSRQHVGRPTLTVIIDAYTRMCVGYFVSLGRPSRVQVAMAMLHAIFPKEAWLTERGLAYTWIAHGIPEVIHCDNAAEFRSVSFKRACADLSIINEWRPIGAPHYGGLIERFIGTTMGDVHLLPGTTFSNVVQRGRYDSQQRAVMSYDAFDRWLALNIIKYHASGHRGLGGFSPQSKWTAATESGWRPQLVPPGHARQIMLNFLPSERRLLRRTGIHFKKLRYWADWLAPSVFQRPELIEIRYDPRDMSSIWVQAPGGTWERVDLYRRQEPFTLAEHEAALRKAAMAGRASRDEATIHQIRLEQQELVAEETRKTSKARRMEAHRRKSIEQSRQILEPANDGASTTPIAPQASIKSVNLADLGDVEEW